MRLPTFGNYLLRSYIIIVLGIILIGLLLETLLAQRNRSSMEAELQATYAPVFAALESTLTPLAPESRAEYLTRASSDWNLPIALLNINDFAGDVELASDLNAGGILVFSNSQAAPVLYRRLADSGQILAIGPIRQTLQGSKFETLVITAYYALVALLVLLWIRPFYRDLTKLRKTAADFGKSDFSARVQLSGKSSILPVAQSFNTMADRIEYLVSAHKELTHAVSHELRTPLARFRFSLEILARNTDPEKKQHYLDNMKVDVAELESLIDELLRYAKLSEENLLTNLVDMDLRQWLQQELQVYGLETINISCTFSNHSPAAAYRASFNPDLMARAIHNIVRNGLRYARSIINVHVHAGADRICIRICDDGPGIPGDMKERIFEPFARLETSRDKSSGGYGLGLAIAARILQRHRGSISVSNCEPTGACFILEWPN